MGVRATWDGLMEVHWVTSLEVVGPAWYKVGPLPTTSGSRCLFSILGAQQPEKILQSGPLLGGPSQLVSG